VIADEALQRAQVVAAPGQARYRILEIRRALQCKGGFECAGRWSFVWAHEVGVRLQDRTTRMLAKKRGLD
jgi:hypothetical protein